MNPERRGLVLVVAVLGHFGDTWGHLWTLRARHELFGRLTRTAVREFH